MRKFINGPFSGTNLEIMPSPAATTLPDGTPIKELAPSQGYNNTQTLHAEGQLDVHARQAYVYDSVEDVNYLMVGPSIAQQWKNEYNALRTRRGWTARYYREGS